MINMVTTYIAEIIDELAQIFNNLKPWSWNFGIKQDYEGYEGGILDDRYDFNIF